MSETEKAGAPKHFFSPPRWRTTPLADSLPSMERPRSILGLTRRALELRWQSLTARGRMLATLAVAFVSFLGVLGIKMALCGSACCASSCPSSRAALEARHEAAAVTASADSATDEHADCPYSQ